MVGPLGQRHRPEAAFGVARISAAPLGVGQVGDAEGDDPLGVRLVPLLVQPVVPGPHTALPELGIGATANTRPQNPVIIDGKLSDAQTPLMSMSFTRAWTS
jgi:hypothetical protein